MAREQTIATLAFCHDMYKLFFHTEPPEDEFEMWHATFLHHQINCCMDQAIVELCSDFFVRVWLKLRDGAEW